MKRRRLVPEVVQTSAMDCGPASLKSLLEGFGIAVSYGRLREACQTDVDGTSIDTLEEVAVQLGLDAAQVMVPVDHVLRPEAPTLPALAVLRLPNGNTHFGVVWRRHGGFVQLMDPASGRRWPTCGRFLEELYVHTMPVAAATWREWAGEDEFLGPLDGRLADLGIAQAQRRACVAAAAADPGWQGLGALDAATRMVTALEGAGAVTRGAEAARVLEKLLVRAHAEVSGEDASIPDRYWSVRAAPPAGEGQLVFRGAVLVRCRGRIDASPRVETAEAAEAAAAAEPAATIASRPPLSPDLVRALSEKPSSPGREIWRRLREDGLLAPSILVGALAVSAFAVLVEALLFRGALEIGRKLPLSHQRLWGLGALLAFLAALFVLELPIARGLLRMGRRLEIRLRMAFLRKIPRLGDRYFQSRLASDMAERSHSLHELRALPELGGELLRAVFHLAFTTAGVVWLDPGSARLAVPIALLGVVLPLALQPLLTERDLRVRSHGAALGRFYLDALLGLTVVRTHGAERTVRGEHEGLLVEWTRAGLSLARAAIWIETVEAVAGFGLAAWLLLDHLARGGSAGGVLLLVYWALELPALGQEVALLARQIPAHKNVTLRLLEPLGAPEEDEGAAGPAAASSPPTAAGAADPAWTPAAAGISVTLENVAVRASGHTLLEGIDLSLAAGEHVAVVGPSGAGKSTLLGVLLGWHRPAEGSVHVGGEALDGGRLELLRRETAWVDPAVQLWNRPLLDNLRYGAPGDAASPMGKTLGSALEAADLHGVLEKLPDGLQTMLGEGGALLSGGEGQRVRLGRALVRHGTRLVLLDEPFRGLDRGQRRRLLLAARGWWRGATLLFVSHDVGDTQPFPRVVVIEGGRIVEDGVPAELAARLGSRYRALLDAEDAVREGLWASERWRRLRLKDGSLVEAHRGAGLRAQGIEPG